LTWFADAADRVSFTAGHHLVESLTDGWMAIDQPMHFLASSVANFYRCPWDRPEHRCQREQEQECDHCRQADRGHEQIRALRQQSDAHYGDTHSNVGGYEEGRHHRGPLFRRRYLIDRGQAAHECQPDPHATDHRACQEEREAGQAQPQFDESERQQQQAPPGQRIASREIFLCPLQTPLFLRLCTGLSSKAATSLINSGAVEAHGIR
jgi:hypothetical protein